jgi:hypothetical protein
MTRQYEGRIDLYEGRIDSSPFAVLLSKLDCEGAACQQRRISQRTMDHHEINLSSWRDRMAGDESNYGIRTLGRKLSRDRG